MQAHKGICNGRSCLIYPSKGLIVSDEGPPDLADFVFRVYRNRLGDRKGKFYVGCYGPLFLTLQANHLGESCRLRVDDKLLATQVIGCIGVTALEGPRLVYGVDKVSLVRWTWKPDGFTSHNKVFAADTKWLNQEPEYIPQDYKLISEVEDEYFQKEETQPSVTTWRNEPEEDTEYMPKTEDYYQDGVFVDEDGEAYILENSEDDAAEYDVEVQESPLEEEANETYQDSEDEKALTPPKTVDKIPHKAQPSEDSESYY